MPTDARAVTVTDLEQLVVLCDVVDTSWQGSVMQRMGFESLRAAGEAGVKGRERDPRRAEYTKGTSELMLQVKDGWQWLGDVGGEKSA